MKTPKFFTTFQISKICGVTIPTIIGWIKSGILPAYKTIGGHRRVKQENLVKFLRENNIPIPPELNASNNNIALIVDDEPEMLKLIQSYFEEEMPGHKTYTATNGFEAGEKVKELNPSLLILDIFLPGINGLEVCKLVRSQNKDIKIIAISGYSDITGDNGKEIIKAGADIFLAKPFNREEMVSAIKKAFKDETAKP